MEHSGETTPQPVYTDAFYDVYGQPSGINHTPTPAEELSYNGVPTWATEVVPPPADVPAEPTTSGRHRAAEAAAEPVTHRANIYQSRHTAPASKPGEYQSRHALPEQTEPKPFTEDTSAAAAEVAANEPQPEQTAAAERPHLTRRQKAYRMGAWALVIAVNVGSIKMTVDTLSERNAPAADAPNPAVVTVQETRKLVNAPDNFTVPVAAKHDYANYDVPEERADQAAFLRRQYFAERHGLTVYNPTETLRALRAAGNEQNGYALTPEQAIETTNAFFKQYDTEVKKATDPLHLGYSRGMRRITDETINSPKMRLNLIYLVSARAALPKEATDGLDVSKILLASQDPNSNERYGAFTVTNKKGRLHDAILVNADTTISAYTLPHEYWHEQDAKMSGNRGGAMQDPGFEALTTNTPDNHGQAKTASAGKEIFFNLEEYIDTRNKMFKNIARIASRTDCLPTANAANTTLQEMGKNTLFVSDYASTGILEAKADIGSIFSSGEKPYNNELSEALNPAVPHVRDQVIRELSRLAEFSPHGKDLREYYLDIGYKNARKSNDLTTLCDKETS